MPYFVIDDFKAGLDVTQPAFKAPAGTLREAINGHVTRGGDFEKRKAFVVTHPLPEGTFGLAEAGGNLYVYGSVADPGVPVGVTYVRLEHPSASPMTAVLQTELFNGKVYVTALYDNGDILHWYDGAQVTDWFDGRARGSFDVAAGATGSITSILVDGVEVLNSTISWTTSNSNTAALIAAQINSYTSTPNYDAVAIGATVYVQAPVGTGAEYNGKEIVCATAGDLSTTTPAAFSGGVTSTTAFQPGRSVRTHKNKMYALSGVNMHYSAIGDPTHFQTSYVGAGASNLATESAGAEELIGLEVYFRRLAIFARRHLQIWETDADPSQYAAVQVTRGVGLVAPRALTAYVDSGIFFLSELGIRAVENKYLTGEAGLVDVGLSIDPLVTDYMKTLDQAVIDQALMVIEPQEGRIWTIVGERVFVLSLFPAKKVSAWSEYRPGFQITDAAVAGSKLYVRGGDTIYLYGGVSGDEYDASRVSARLPFMSAKAPASFKTWTALDVGIEGEWTVSIYPDIDQEDEGEVIAKLTGPSFNRSDIPLVGYGSHISIGAVHEKAEYARFSMVALHYEGGEAG